MRRGFTLWFTGLSGSGKTTLAGLVEDIILERGALAEILDGELVRREISPELGFSPADRALHMKRLAYMADLLNRNGVNALVAAVSPLRNGRAEMRRLLNPFIEVYTHCSLEVCKQRKASGLYRLVESGGVTGVAGIDFPYEPPERAEVEVRTDLEEPEESAAKIVHVLEILGLLPSIPSSAFTPEEEAELRRKLTDLGYM